MNNRGPVRLVNELVTIFSKMSMIFHVLLTIFMNMNKDSSRARTVNFYFHLSIYSSRLCVACNEKLYFVYISV